MTAKVGLVVGREWSFPPKFIDEVNRRDKGVVADFIKLGGTAMDAPPEYAVLVDRISHEVPFYRSYLKHAVLQGVAVFSHPCNDRVLTSVFPGRATDSVELGRFVLLDEVPGNGETWMLFHAWRPARYRALYAAKLDWVDGYPVVAVISDR